MLAEIKILVPKNKIINLDVLITLARAAKILIHDQDHYKAPPLPDVCLMPQNCRANDKLAVSVCFSTECVSYNSNHPIRYCQQCHNIRHNNRRGGDHIFHTSLSHVSQMDPQTQTYMVQSIVSLLKEAEPVALDVDSDRQAINTSKGTMAFVTSNRTRNKDS
ncbi:hypothetical protein TSAR_007976, partial [Trichomalopsis sarcophagae]